MLVVGEKGRRRRHGDGPRPDRRRSRGDAIWTEAIAKLQAEDREPKRSDRWPSGERARWPISSRREQCNIEAEPA